MKEYGPLIFDFLTRTRTRTRTYYKTWLVFSVSLSFHGSNGATCADHCACAVHEHSWSHYWIKWHIQLNVQKSSVGSKIICSQVSEVLHHLFPPCHTHLVKWLFFFLIVRWKPFLFPLLNVTGFSADSHRSTWLKCEVLIRSSSFRCSLSGILIFSDICIQDSFFHPIFIRACFLQALKHIVIFPDIYHCAHYIISWLSAIGLLVVGSSRKRGSLF